MKALLLRQFKKYPKMQLCDAVKLVYQNTFGGGHMIHNEADSLRRLNDEYAAVRKSSEGTVFEGIGNGLCRLHLHALHGISIATVNRFFVLSANAVRGSVSRFEENITVFMRCCETHELPFDVEDVKRYINVLKADGYPPVSHSAAYRAAYHPAYRVVGAAFRDYFQLFVRIEELLAAQDSVTVAIDGNSGSGKTTLAALIGEVYDCNVFPMDHFFLPPHMKTAVRLREPGGNVDRERFLRDIIGGIRSGASFSYRPYDCKSQTMGEAVQVCPKRLNIVEGCYSMHPSLRGSYDLKVFMQISVHRQKRRILKRNGAFMLNRYIREWIPLENAYFDAFDIRSSCDLVFGAD